MKAHNTREEVVKNLLKTAVSSQIQLWDAASEVADAIDRQLSDVLSWIQQVSITAGAGKEFLDTDVDLLLKTDRDVNG
jgi:hypothetical protein